jgi:hypothetical protein
MRFSDVMVLFLYYRFMHMLCCSCFDLEGNMPLQNFL